MTLIGPRRQGGRFYKKRPIVKRPRKNFPIRSRNYAKLGGTLMPNVLYTKLRYAHGIQGVIIPANSYRSLAISGSNIAPIGIDSVQVGAFPESTVGQANPVNTERLWSGLNGYALWFEKMNILTNAIHVKVWSDSTGGASTNANLQVCLVAFCFRAQTPFGIIPGLDGYTTEDLIQQKNTVTRMISGSGGKNYCHLKMKRATKTMLGMTNLTDNFTTSCGLQPNLLVDGPSPLANPNPEAQWYYYLRVQNPNEIAVDITYSVQMHANVKFTQRTFALPVAATTGAGPV